jgi:hypothetical protein
VLALVVCVVYCWTHERVGLLLNTLVGTSASMLKGVLVVEEENGLPLVECVPT